MKFNCITPYYYKYNKNEVTDLRERTDLWGIKRDRTEEELLSLIESVRLTKKTMKTITLKKVGSFYEAYHQDALILMQLASLNPMSSKYPAVGFPVKFLQKIEEILQQNNFKILFK